MPLTPADLSQITALIQSQLNQARVKISNLPEVGPGFTNEGVFPFVDEGSTQKISLNKILLKGFTTVPVGQDLRAMDSDTLTDGQMFYITGILTANDGGEGFWLYDADSVASDNIGTVIQPDDGNGRFLRQYSGLIDAAWFGMSQEAAYDNSTSIQSAIDLAIETKGGVSLPAGTYEIKEPIVISEGYQNLICGTGATIIKYTGDDDTVKVLTLEDCYMVEIRNLRLLASTPAAVGVWFKNGSGVSVVSTRCKLVDCEIDGITNNLETCVRVGGTGSTDANNDFHIIQNCTLTNFSADGVSLENSQVYNIQLRGTMILGNGSGVHLVNTSNGPSGYGGSFSWIGGGGGGVTGAAFFFGNPTNGPTLIQDVNFETCDRLLEGNGPAGFIYNVTFRDVRWAADALNADGKMIKWKYAGAIEIDGGNFGDGAASPTALTIDFENNYPTFSVLILKGALFTTTCTTEATLCTSLPGLMIDCLNYDQDTDTYSSYASEYYPDGFPYLSNQRLFTGTYAGLQKVRAENLDAAGEVCLELATPNVASAHTFQLRQFGTQVWLYDSTATQPLLKLLLDGSKAVVLANGGWLMSGNGDPTGSVLAPVGSTYQRLDGGTGTSFYVKESGGSTSAGWVAK